MSAKLSILVTVIYLLTAILTISAIPTSRIVGGENAEIGQFPHQVAIEVYNSFKCAGSIISARYILTVAHCVTIGGGRGTIPPRHYTVRVGSIQRQSGGEVVIVKKVIVHETYDNFLDDVALLELEEELVFTSNIKSIELYDGEIPQDDPVILSGWGRLTRDGANSDQLQFHTQTRLEEEKCIQQAGWVDEQIACLAHPNGRGVCSGDSGGSAQYQGKLAGIANELYSTCGTTYPDGITKVSYHRDWILANMV